MKSIRKEISGNDTQKTMSVLYEISNAVNTTDNLNELYQSIYRSLNRLIRLPNCFIALVDRSRKRLSFPFFVDEHDTKAYISRKIEKYEEISSNTSRVISQKAYLLLSQEMLQERRKANKIIGTVPAIWLGVPLTVRDEVIGVMVVQHYTDPDYFSQKDVDLLMAVSDQVALAIDRKKSWEETKQNEKITHTLFSISNAVNTTDNLDDLYRSIYNSLNRLIKLPNCFIAIVDTEKKRLSFPFFVDEFDTIEVITRGLEKYEESTSNTSQVIFSKKPLLLTKKMLRQKKEQQKTVGTSAVIWLGVPLIVRDEVIGVVVVQHYTDPDYFSQKDVDLLMAVSDQVALAIDRKKSWEETKQNERITRTLFSISNAVNTTDNLDDLYQSIYRSLNMLIELPNFFICIMDEAKRMMHFPFYLDEYDSDRTIDSTVDYSDDSNYITAEIIKDKRPLFLTQQMLNDRAGREKLVGALPKIWLGVPLMTRNKVIGVMAVQHYHDPDYFTQKDMELLISVSDQVALALERKQFQEDLKKAEKETRLINTDLKKEIQERKRSEGINKTLFAISNAVSKTLDLDDLYCRVHELLGSVMDVTNFFVANINQKEGTLYFPYFVDTMDDNFAPIHQFTEGDSLAGWVVKKRASLFLDQKQLNQRKKQNGIVGSIPLVWLGVPIIIKEEVVGLMAVQSYTDPDIYTPQDLKILASVADQIAIAIDRKRTEDNMRASEKRYRSMFRHAPTAMFEVDFRTGKFTTVNDEMCSQLGYTEDEFLSMNPLDLLTAESRQIFVNGYKDLIKGKKVSETIEYDVYKKDGEIKCVLLNSEYVFEDSRLAGARIVVHDITERKKIEEMMIQSEKMMSVGGLAAGMAHEINNPLAGIMQNVQVVLNRLSKPLPANIKAAEQSGTTLEAVCAYMDKRQIISLLQSVHKAGSNAAEIVENMLSFARKGDSIGSRQSIPKLLKKAVDLAQSDYNLKKKYDFRQVRIQEEFESDLPDVLCEPSKLLQVFFNVIKNAAQAMHEVGTRKSPPQLTFRVKAKKDTVRIEIADNGPGMDENTRKRLFEPFFTTKSVDKGTGMGLSLAYFIVVENHGGKMDVQSAPGEGASFIINLPVDGIQHAQKQQEPYDGMQ